MQSQTPSKIGRRNVFGTANSSAIHANINYFERFLKYFYNQVGYLIVALDTGRMESCGKGVVHIKN